MTKGYVTVDGGKYKKGDTLTFRPYTSAKEAGENRKSVNTKVWEVTVDNPDKTGKGKCTFVKEIKMSPLKESLAFLIENELEKAGVVLAAKGILDKLQDAAEKIASLEIDELMPILDSLRLTFGAQVADQFNNVTTEKLRAATETIKDAKEAISSQVARLEGEVNGEGPSNDMSAPPEDDDFGDELGGDEDFGDMGDVAPPEEGRPDLGNDAMDAAFDAVSDNDTAAGRARKESVQRNVKALTESSNPDRLIFETFRRTLKESRDAIRAAKAVAKAFAIDFSDVVSIIKEGKENKDKPFECNRKRFATLADAKAYAEKLHTKTGVVAGIENKGAKEVDEGKTWKDQKGRKEKNNDYSQRRSDKKRERDDEMNESQKKK